MKKNHQVTDQNPTAPETPLGHGDQSGDTSLELGEEGLAAGRLEWSRGVFHCFFVEKRLKNLKKKKEEDSSL